MDMRPPKYASDHIAKIGYDDDTGTLVVQFQRGGSYRYQGVSPELATELHSAPSAGAFFHGRIRGRFKYGRF